MNDTINRLNTHQVRFPGHEYIRVTVGPDQYIPASVDPDSWEHRLYRVTITYAGRTMHVQYSQGMAIVADDVSPHDVLHSIVSDAVASEQSFLDFCNEYGYDPDTADARRIYRACDANFKRIARVFKGDAREFYDMVNEWQL